MLRSGLLSTVNFATYYLAKGYSMSHHSQKAKVVGSCLSVKIIPALKDNYMYLITDLKTNDSAIVDPVDSKRCIEEANEENVTISKVLTTHHHWDHASGNDDMKKSIPSLEVYGGDDRVNALTHKVEHGHKIQIGSLNVECLFTPCHTTGHICYYITSDSDPPAVFTGDTLFSAGCGRFFEGTPEQMHHALVDVLSSLPPETRVFCGHEYTVNNLKFATHVEPDSEAIKKRMEWAKDKRSRHEPTVPSTIEEELTFNPFMRVNEASIHKHTSTSTPIDAMGALRREKDKF